MSFPKYEPSRLATLPSTLDPAEYDISPETRKAQAERLAIRSRLKREYLLQYNNPSRRELIVRGDRPERGESRVRARAVPSKAAQPPPDKGTSQRGGHHSPSVSQTLVLFQAQRAGQLTSPLTLGREFDGQENGFWTHTWLSSRLGIITSHLGDLEKVIQLCSFLQFSYLRNGNIIVFNRFVRLLRGLNEIRQMTG